MVRPLRDYRRQHAGSLELYTVAALPSFRKYLSPDLATGTVETFVKRADKRGLKE